MNHKNQFNQDLHFATRNNFHSSVPLIPVTSDPTEFHITTLWQAMQASAEKSLEDLVEEKVPKAVQTRTIVLLGTPVHEIVNLAARVDADTIVLSSQGESGWQRFISGSVAEKVVRLATCPVLTVQVPNQESYLT